MTTPLLFSIQVQVWKMEEKRSDEERYMRGSCNNNLIGSPGASLITVKWWTWDTGDEIAGEEQQKRALLHYKMGGIKCFWDNPTIHLSNTNDNYLPQKMTLFILSAIKLIILWDSLHSVKVTGMTKYQLRIVVSFSI